MKNSKQLSQKSSQSFVPQKDNIVLVSYGPGVLFGSTLEWIVVSSKGWREGERVCSKTRIKKEVKSNVG